MTNKEAIKHLEFIKIAFQIDAKPIGVKTEALDLAIKALRRVDCIYVKDECYAACGECGYCDAEKEGTE